MSPVSSGEDARPVRGQADVTSPKPRLLVACDHVSKSFGGVRALRGVSLRVAAGETVLIRGDNGSGKSTLLSLLAGLTKATTGRVRFEGLGGDREAARASIGWLGHDGQAYGDLSVAENLRFFASIVGADAAAVARVSQRLELQRLADRVYRVCSRGQRQRVALARAILHAPQLLLLDEPTTGLDLAGVETLETVLREEASRGASLVVVTHDVAFAERLGARSVWLERGTLKLPAD